MTVKFIFNSRFSLLKWSVDNPHPSVYAIKGLLSVCVQTLDARELLEIVARLMTPLPLQHRHKAIRLDGVYLTKPEKKPKGAKFCFILHCPDKLNERP